MDRRRFLAFTVALPRRGGREQKHRARAPVYVLEHQMTVTSPVLPLAPDDGLLSGKSALVTGAGPAGVAAARALAAAAASVAFAGADDEPLLRTVRAIEASRGRAVALPGDVRDSEAIRRAVESATESFGALDLAVNTVGAFDGPRRGTDAACRAVYLAMRWELDAILASGGGAIVNAAASPLGRHGEDAQCIIGLTRAAALDQIDRAVRLNTVLTRSGKAGDFAATAVWLCSDRAADVTGAAVPIGRRPPAA
jgi:NAD(P)-dependent dehydrogenase (short-subunit alcohol dehydrogenase family)